MPIAPKKAVWGFLSKLKLVPLERITIQDRKKNREFLATVGSTQSEATEVLRSLAVRDYVKGPEADDNQEFSGN